MEDNLNKKDKIHLILIDKLGIATLLIFLGFWVNSRLIKIEKRHENELTNKNQEFVLYRDSVGRIYEERYKKLSLERQQLEKLSDNNREDLIRRENNLFTQRLKDYDFFKSIQIEKIKSEISVEARLNSSSIDYISKTWEKINEINIGTEVLTYNHIVYMDDSILVSDERILTDDSYGKDNKSLFQLDNHLNIDSLRHQILNTEKFINKNRFWLGERQRQLLIDYLKLNYKLTDQIKLKLDHEKIRNTIMDIDKMRQDVFKYRDELFQKL